MRIVLQGMEAAFKKGFRTYGGQKIFSSVMIAPAKNTPFSASNFLTTKIKLIEKGTIRSSPPAQARICQFRGHEGDVCAACTIEKRDKIKSGIVEDKIPDTYEDDE